MIHKNGFCNLRRKGVLLAATAPDKTECLFGAPFCRGAPPQRTDFATRNYANLQINLEGAAPQGRQRNQARPWQETGPALLRRAPD